MPSGSHSLLWYPRTQQVERSSEKLLPLPSPEVLMLHRSVGPNLGFSVAHVEIGASLLPEAERPAYGQSIKLLWIPLLPSRCLLLARDASGALRVAARAPGKVSEQLAASLEHLEVECAWAFEVACSETPNPSELTGHLDGALELAAVSVLLFCDEVASPPFWQRAAS